MHRKVLQFHMAAVQMHYCHNSKHCCFHRFQTFYINFSLFLSQQRREYSFLSADRTLQFFTLMCHFFLIPHYDTKHLRCIRGQRRKRTWQTSKTRHILENTPVCAKVRHMETKSFSSSTTETGMARKTTDSAADTLCPLSCLRGMDSVAS